MNLTMPIDSDITQQNGSSLATRALDLDEEFDTNR
jgi:hypothetical protein